MPESPMPPAVRLELVGMIGLRSRQEGEQEGEMSLSPSPHPFRIALPTSAADPSSLPPLPTASSSMFSGLGRSLEFRSGSMGNWVYDPDPTVGHPVSNS